jgi:hypothetical protein
LIQPPAVPETKPSIDATIVKVYGGYSSAAERLTVAQDVVGSIPTSRPNPSFALRVFDISSPWHTAISGERFLPQRVTFKLGLSVYWID